MRAVGLRTLKNKLSEYVRLAAGGETVLITDRERVVAEIVPPRAERSAILTDAMLADAVRQGLVRPPVFGSDGVPARRPVMPFADMMTELREDRVDR